MSELNVLRKVALQLVQPGSGFIPETKAEFVLEVEGMVTALHRAVQFKQLHLDPNAAVFLDHLQLELVQISEDCTDTILSNKNGQILAETKLHLVVLIDEINNLLDYFRLHYSYCFNFQMIVPLKLKQREDAVLMKIWDKCLQSFRNAGLDDGLVAVLTEYCQEIKANKRPTFHAVDFFKAMTDAINKISPSDINTIETDLFKIFCYHNFNYPPLIQYCISKMQRNYDTIENYREEYIQITLEIRTLRQLMIRKDSSYDPSAIDLRGAMCHILENELICIKKLINMNKKIFEGNGSKFFLHQFYFKISISMEQFLFVFRLMIDKGTILVKRKADLYEFIHTHVGTAKKDHLSIGNMQNTFSENNRITAIKVRALLQSMINHIDEKYLSFGLLIFLI